jgi:hypothetical protein
MLTFPFAWRPRPRLGRDGELLRQLTRLVVETVLDFYALRAAASGQRGARSGAVAVVQRTSSDMRLHPHLHLHLHLHLVVLDGTWVEEGVSWCGRGSLTCGRERWGRSWNGAWGGSRGTCAGSAC